MNYTGPSKTFEMGYHEGFEKVTDIGYANVITGFRFDFALPKAPNPVWSAAMRFSNFSTRRALQYLEQKHNGTYLLLPTYNTPVGDDRLTGNGYKMQRNLSLETKAWKSIKAISAKTIKCTGCGTVFNKDQIDTASCCLCYHPYNIKASKEYIKKFEMLGCVDVYSDELLKSERSMCSLVSVKEILDKNNELRGYNNGV